MAQYGAAQPIVDTLKNLEKYNPAEWLKSDKKSDSDKRYTMNWKPEANAEQKAQIAKRGTPVKSTASTGAKKPNKKPTRKPQSGK